jgi:hypothetical protein
MVLFANRNACIIKNKLILARTNAKVEFAIVLSVYVHVQPSNQRTLACATNHKSVAHALVCYGRLICVDGVHINLQNYSEIYIDVGVQA